MQISTCDQCQRVNSKLTTTTPEHPVPAQSPWFHVGIDFVGLVTPESVHGNNYIIIRNYDSSSYIGIDPGREYHLKNVTRV